MKPEVSVKCKNKQGLAEEGSDGPMRLHQKQPSPDKRTVIAGEDCPMLKQPSYFSQESEEEEPESSEEDSKPASGLSEKLLKSRTVVLSSGIDSEQAQGIIEQLLLLDHENDKDPISLWINSPGGEVFAGFAIYDVIRFVRSPVRSIVVGLAASMGSIIALAPQKGSRFCLPHSKFLIHQPLMHGYQGRATDLEIQANEILKDRERIIDIYAEHTEHPRLQIARDIDRDYWMDATEAQNYGLVDRIITSMNDIQDTP